jgi:hypothetical protein
MTEIYLIDGTMYKAKSYVNVGTYIRFEIDEKHYRIPWTSILKIIEDKT